MWVSVTENYFNRGNLGKCFIEASEISNVTEEEKIFALHTSLTVFFHQYQPLQFTAGT